MDLVMAGRGDPKGIITGGLRTGDPSARTRPTLVEHGENWVLVERTDANLTGIASDGSRTVVVTGSSVGADADATADGLLRHVGSGTLSPPPAGDLVVVVVDENGCAAATGAGNHRLVTARTRTGTSVLGTNLHAVAGLVDPMRPADRSEEDFLLGFGFVPGPGTVFADVEQLPPGKVHRWGHRPTDTPDVPVRSDADRGRSVRIGSFDDAVDELHRRFVHTVEELAGDGNEAAVLLGGLDSALVASMLVRLGKQVTTYTYGFGDPRYEQRDVEAVTTSLGVAQRWVHITPEIVLGGLQEFGRIFSQPGPQPHYQLHTLHAARTVRADGFSQVLTGDGCDAVFLGYPTVNRRARLMARLGSLPAATWGPLRGVLSSPVTERHLGHVARMGRSTMGALALEPPARGHLPTRYLDEVALARLRTDPPPPQRMPVAHRRRELAADLTDLDPVRLAFHGNALTGQSRIKVEGTVMATGLRQSTPFGHPRVRDFVAALPVEYLRPAGSAAGSAGKALLVEMIRKYDLLPPRVLELPKQSPAESPIDRWYAGPLRAEVMELLGYLPFEWNRRHVEELMRPKLAEELYRRHVAISHNALQAVGLLASYASFHRP